MKIPLLVFMSEIKIDLTLKKSNFLFLFCFKIAKLSLFLCINHRSRDTASFLESFYIKSDASSVFIGYANTFATEK